MLFDLKSAVLALAAFSAVSMAYPADGDAADIAKGKKKHPKLPKGKFPKGKGLPPPALSPPGPPGPPGPPSPGKGKGPSVLEVRMSEPEDIAPEDVSDVSTDATDAKGPKKGKKGPKKGEKGPKKGKKGPKKGKLPKGKGLAPPS